jgi:hypothetical protein
VDADGIRGFRLRLPLVVLQARGRGDGVCGGEEARGGSGAVVGHADLEEGEAVRLGFCDFGGWFGKEFGGWDLYINCDMCTI